MKTPLLLGALPMLLGALPMLLATGAFADPPAAPPADAATLDFLADWTAPDDAPAPDDPLLHALDALLPSPAPAEGLAHERPEIRR